LALPPKVCPECREEYLHSASECAHCEVPLVLEGEVPDAPVAAELPPASELECVRVAAIGWVLALSDVLSAAGITHRVEIANPDPGSEAAGPQTPYGVFVRAEDHTAAARIDADFMRAQIPDSPGDADFAVEEGQCPACGEALDASAPECPACGIALAPAE
jgi:hypothetical protein